MTRFAHPARGAVFCLALLVAVPAVTMPARAAALPTPSLAEPAPAAPLPTPITAMQTTTAALAATTPPDRQQPSPEQIAGLMRRHAEAAQPGPEHERLAAMSGRWEVELTMWPEPGADPVTTAGTAEAQTILSDRFLMMSTDLADTDPAGQQVSIIGFDRRSSEYTILALDTSGTYWVTAQGPADESGDRAVLAGEDYDPIVEFMQEYDFILSWPDEGTFVVEIVFKDEVHTRGGPPFKMVELTARRSR